MRPHRACKGKVFWHPCSICGALDAPFGRDARLRAGVFGQWFCRDCLPDDYLPKETSP